MASESKQQFAVGDMVKYTGKSFTLSSGVVVEAGTVGVVESFLLMGTRVNVNWSEERNSASAVDSHLLERVELSASSTTTKGGKTSRRKRTKKSRTAGGKKSRKQRKRTTLKGGKRKRRRTRRRR
jgi:prophage tail gpP-like protein